jgi:hypothetical protein
LNIERVNITNDGDIVCKLCNDADNAQRCRRAQYHAVYGEDPPLSYTPVSGREDGSVWVRDMKIWLRD